MARIGLVLGAGGIVGQAYHAGVLAALEHDLGWDPRTADVIVGSSAGSLTGALLRLGVPASDLAAYAVEAPLSVESEDLVTRLGGRDEPPAFAAPRRSACSGPGASRRPPCSAGSSPVRRRRPHR